MQVASEERAVRRASHSARSLVMAMMLTLLAYATISAGARASRRGRLNFENPILDMK